MRVKPLVWENYIAKIQFGDLAITFGIHPSNNRFYVLLPINSNKWGYPASGFPFVDTLEEAKNLCQQAWNDFILGQIEV